MTQIKHVGLTRQYPRIRPENTAAEIAPSLCKIFNLSLSHGVVPVLWKRHFRFQKGLPGSDRELSTDFSALHNLKSVRKVRF